MVVIQQKSDSQNDRLWNGEGSPMPRIKPAQRSRSALLLDRRRLASATKSVAISRRRRQSSNRRTSMLAEPAG
jgi:hypothetical protein